MPNPEPPYLTDTEFIDVTDRLLRQAREDRLRDLEAMSGLDFHGQDVTACNVVGQAKTAGRREFLHQTAIEELAARLGSADPMDGRAIRAIAARLAFLAQTD